MLNFIPVSLENAVFFIVLGVILAFILLYAYGSYVQRKQIQKQFIKEPVDHLHSNSRYMRRLNKNRTIKKTSYDK